MMKKFTLLTVNTQMYLDSLKVKTQICSLQDLLKTKN